MLTSPTTTPPTGVPTGTPTGTPTIAPTGTQTGTPTIAPTGTQTGTPTIAPTGTPTGTQTGIPTTAPICSISYSRLCALRVDYECSNKRKAVLTYDQQLFTSVDLKNTNFQDGMFTAPTTGSFAVNFWTKGFTWVEGGQLYLYHNKKRIAWDESNQQYDQYNRVVSLIAGDTLHIRVYVNVSDCRRGG